MMRLTLDLKTTPARAWTTATTATREIQSDPAIPDAPAYFFVHFNAGPGTEIAFNCRTADQAFALTKALNIDSGDQPPIIGPSDDDLHKIIRRNPR